MINETHLAAATPSQFAAQMAATWGQTWSPMGTLGPSSDIAATMSMKSTRRRRFGREYTATLVSPRGNGAPSGDRYRRHQLHRALPAVSDGSTFCLQRWHRMPTEHPIAHN